MQKFGWLNDFMDVIYPASCLGCDQPLVANEAHLCLYCLSELPKTNLHKIPENEVLRIFNGRCLLQKASSYLYFSKGGIVQSLMHAFKYKGHTEIGSLLGQMAGNELGNDGFFQDIDFLVPVPLHPKKLAKRGYNQSEIFAHGINSATGIPVSITNLIRTSFSETQTRKSRFARWLNVESIFSIIDKPAFENKHILLVDDVVTTGSTIEGCVVKMETIRGIKISLLTLAMAK